MEGTVVADSSTVVKPSALIREDAELSVAQRQRYVGRGGLKLEGALERFQLEVTGRVVADIGASTGGFTDCLLQSGAAKVYAVDVGYGQLDYKLRQDPRVVVMERVNARYAVELPERVDLATIDVSFISLEKVLPTVAALVRGGGHILAMVKPQFEAGREQVGRGGVVRDPLVHASVLGRFILWAVDHGLRLEGVCASPVVGSDGNREFFVLLWKPGD
jgi:23S rRNA (cytidine1920-2'-O)/16S rRNA (cytidine1409-2'-O)-methyltransferase